MNSWKKIISSILIIVLLLLGITIFLVGTNTGLNLLLNAVNRLVPGLEIGQITGNWRGVCLQDIYYERPGISVKAGEFYLAVKLNCLYKKSFYFNKMFLKDINISINPKQILNSEKVRKKDSGPLDFFTSYPIVLSKIIVNNLNLKIEDTFISVVNFSSGVIWRGKNLTLTPTLLQEVLIKLPKVSDITNKKIVRSRIYNPYQEKKLLTNTLKDLFSKPIIPEMIDVHFPLNLNIEEFKGEQLHLISNTDLIIHNLLLRASNVGNHIQIDNLDIISNYGMLNIAGTAKLCEKWPINMTINSRLNINPLKGEKAKLKLSGALRDRLEIEVNLSGLVNMMLHAQTKLTDVGLPLNLEIVSKKLHWPFVGAKQLQADELKLEFNGRMNNYTLFFHTAIKIQGIPTATITLNAKGNEQQIHLNKLIIAVMEGKIQFKALLNWQQDISWYSELKLEDINTEKEIPNWPSKLNGIVKAYGNLYGSNWQISVPKLKITGSIKDTKINVEGSIKSYEYMQCIIPELYVRLGYNSANFKGELGIKKLSLNATIDAPNLNNTLLPGLSGMVKGFVRVRGTMSAPQIITNIIASNLHWQELNIARILLDADVKSTDQISGHLNIDVEHIVQPGINISLLTLDIKGNENKHTLQFKIYGKPISGQSNLVGNFDRPSGYWKGMLDRTYFDTPIGLWALTQAIMVDYYNLEQKANISSHCWNNLNSEICIPYIINTGAKGHAIIKLNRLDLAMLLKSFVPDTIQISGIFNGKVDVAWNFSSKKRLLQGSLMLSGYNMKIVRKIDNTPLVVTINNMELNVRLRDNQAKIKWIFLLAKNGYFNGQIQIIDLYGYRNLKGSINIFNFNLEVANTILLQEENISGILNANLQLIGNTKKPQLFGQMQLNCTNNIDNNQISLNTQPSKLILKFNGLNSTLSGKIRTRYGELNLSGDMNWKEISNWYIRIIIKANRIRVSIPPIMHLDISPDIVFEIMPSLFTLNGRIDVPWARIILHKVPESAVKVSSDEVLFNENSNPTEIYNASIPISSNLIVHMGNNVHIDAFGLKAKLTGDLKVVQDERGFGFNGQINIPDGQFHAYGQDLIVRKGKLLFYGPLDQSVLNIEAIRNPKSTENNVIVGVRVTASIDELRAEIFSDPIMSQQEALSYLLCGQKLGSKQNDGIIVTSTLIGLGIAQSDQLIGKIGKTFGISNLTLNTQGVGDSSKVVISGYILPDLQVKYGVGIFNSLAIFTLRYHLMPKLYLEAVSGANQALDLVYQFEF